MQAQLKLLVAATAVAVAGFAVAQTAATTAGRAASAAVTPGDQDSGRNPANRSGGVMGTAPSAATAVGGAASAAVTPGDQDMGRNPGNRDGGLMGNDRSTTGMSGMNSDRPVRAARVDRN